MSDDAATSLEPARRRRPILTNRAWIMGVLVLGAAGVALVVIDRRDAPDIAEDTRAVPGEPDFFMRGTTVHQYRNDGSLEYELRSNEVQHFERRAETRLREPELALFDPGQAPWRMSARQGTLRRPPSGAPEETVELRDDVVLEQTRADGDFIRLSTSSLDVYPRRQYARTDRDVMIDSLVGRTAANGLEGNLQLGTFSFHSSDGARVHTVLQPEQFK